MPADTSRKIPITLHPRVFASLGSDLVTSDFVAITELVNAWTAVAEGARGELTYSDKSSRLLRYPLEAETSSLSNDQQRFAAARSMRDVEPNVKLNLRDPYGRPLTE